jgi:hypothetical protein
MYYECAPKATDRANYNDTHHSGPVQICLAASVDGVNWMEYNESLPNGHSFQNAATTTPTPVVERDPAVEALCGWSETEIPGQYVADFPECDDINAYGSGHPSAISRPIGSSGAREVWLYYYDSKGAWGDSGSFLRKISYGINFGQAVKIKGLDPVTGLPTNADPILGKVQYFDVRVGDRTGVFISTYPRDSSNYFTYSFDGEHWLDSQIVRPEMRVGEAVSDEMDGPPTHCIVPGAPAMVGDKYGSLNSLSSVTILSGEGYKGFQDGCTATNGCTCYSPLEEPPGRRGATWSLYLLKGDFGHIAKPGDDVCDLYDEQSPRDQFERGIAGTVGDIVWIDEGGRYSYSSWSDFQAKNFNLGSKAYLNVNNATFDDLEQCGYDGPRPEFASPDAASVARGLAVKVRVLDNDSGVGLDPASIVIAPRPSHGVVSVDGAGVVTYTHNNDAATADSFGYSVRAANGLRSNVAGVQVTIAASQAIYRVNAGGPALSGGWTEDRAWSSGGIPSSRVNAAATLDKTYFYAGAVTVDGSVPAGVPTDLFKDDRYALPGGTRMKWEFPVDSDRQVEVRLYFAENYRTTPGRIFDVTAEGIEMISDLDVFVAAGNVQHKGLMRAFKTFATDGTLNLEFVQQGDSPIVDGLEILGFAPLANPVPTAIPDTSKVAAGWKTKVDVLANDSDTSPGSLAPTTVTIVNGPQYGTATVNPTTGVVTYTNTNGAQTADRFSYTVKDNLGALSNATVVTIAIKPVSVLYRVNAGGASVAATPSWSTDTVATPSTYVNHTVSGNNNVYSTAATIQNLPPGFSQALLQSQRFDNGLAPNMIWNFPVSAGSGPEVEVQLYFAEIYLTGPGQRVFGVKLENDVAYPSLDIYQLSGGKDRYYSPSPYRLSTDGTLTIDFMLGAANAPIISAIEVRGPAN